MLRISSLFLTLFILISGIQAQNQGKTWYFGEGLGLDFTGNGPSKLYEGRIFGNPQQGQDYPYSEGSSVISDSSGSLLLYSNGEKVWNRDHEVLPNGDSLDGFYSSTQAALILPRPLSDSLFYLFTTDGVERDLGNGLRYSVIDICMDDGYGNIPENKKNTPLLDTAAEKLCAVRHVNDTDLWVLSHEHGSDAFYAFLLTPNGISDTVISHAGSVHEGSGTLTGIGQMKASPDGQRLGLVVPNDVPNIAELFDFDPSTGIVSNPIPLETNYGEYGVEFSPDGSKFYMTDGVGIYQFDLSAGTDSASINASRDTLDDEGLNPSGMQLGPDGKIYVVRGGNLGVVHQPDSAAPHCQFQDSAIVYDSTMGASLPGFLSNYDYRSVTSECVSTGLKKQQRDPKPLKLFPNPSSGQTRIRMPQRSQAPYTFTLYNSKGERVKNGKLPARKSSFSVASLETGIYFFSLEDGTGRRFTEKLLVEQVP